MKLPGRSEDVLKMSLAHQITEAMDSKDLESPGESHAGRRKMLKPGGSQRKNWPPRERVHTVLTAPQTRFQESLEMADDGSLWAKPHWTWGCLAMHYLLPSTEA